MASKCRSEADVVVEERRTLLFKWHFWQMKKLRRLPFRSGEAALEALRWLPSAQVLYTWKMAGPLAAVRDAR